MFTISFTLNLLQSVSVCNIPGLTQFSARKMYSVEIPRKLSGARGNFSKKKQQQKAPKDKWQNLIPNPWLHEQYASHLEKPPGTLTVYIYLNINKALCDGLALLLKTPLSHSIITKWYHRPPAQTKLTLRFHL